MVEHVTGTIEDVPIALAYQRNVAARATLSRTVGHVPRRVVQDVADIIGSDPDRLNALLRFRDLAAAEYLSDEQAKELDFLRRHFGLPRAARGLLGRGQLRRLADLITALLPSKGLVPDSWTALAQMVERERTALVGRGPRSFWAQPDAMSSALLRAWLLADPAREQVVFDIDAMLDDRSTNPAQVRAALRGIGVDALDDDAAMMYQAGMLVGSHRDSVRLEDLVELARTDIELAHRTNMRSGSRARRAGEAAARRLSNPPQVRRTVVSGGLPGLGKNR